MSEDKAEKPTKTSRYRIEVPEQSVAEEFVSKEAVRKFFEREIGFWDARRQTHNMLRHEGREYNIGLANEYSDFWRRVVRDFDNQIKAHDVRQFLKELEEQISKSGWLISTSKLMEKIGDEKSSTLFILVYSRGLGPVGQPLQDKLHTYRSLCLFGPFANNLKNSESARSMVESAATNLVEAREFLSEAQDIYAEKKQKLEELVKTYDEKIALDAPASYWATIENNARASKWILLGVFVAAIASPFLLVWCNWHSVFSFWESLFGSDNENPVLSNLVFVSVPLLAYGWILRHISRLLLKAIEVESDASFRVMYAKTYLSLKRHSGELDEHDRAIVLNALFRPLNSGGSDDGPPIGVVDLLKNRAVSGPP